MIFGTIIAAIFTGFFFVDRYLVIGQFIVDYVISWSLGASFGLCFALSLTPYAKRWKS